MRSKKIILLLFLFNVILVKSQITEKNLITKKIKFLSDNKKQTTLDALIDSTVFDFIQSPQNCGLSIGVIKDEKSIFYNYGETKRGGNNLPSQNTIYEIGSISKTFCGILLAYGVTESKINLEDDIRNYLPEKYPNLETHDQVIKVKNLANHTSGLPRLPENIFIQPNFDTLNPYKNYDKQKVFDYLKTITLTSEPGKIYSYSNLGMGLLGMILEKVYANRFDELIKEKICTVNGMNNTAVNLATEQQILFADGYNADGKNTPHWDLGALTAAGGIKSSTSDMVKYLQYNLDEKDSVTKLAHQSTFNNGTNIALAWHIVKTKMGNELIWHNGGTFGFSSFCGFIKEKKCALIVFSNSGTNVDYIGLSILKFLQK
ncbi:MAG: serine hydrolase domain-containing protein [Bacteroidota bacterium]